eukprot:CAMPEP_0202877938 /NCGR_PEP_ID=MMETSP1391-20130828/31364_1 /ASSEMBLY_ACC=CAM_ASM_000867 /TAXON_ID=1034604 /ORGANISM="Chlamydomonas leiostraca, Strain SAG 11-49" /LENGTH=90 /DNA_ID=CAMNT_0049560047 /DNA_START=106 /DNA_END=374 /DNA_ORIENTATION=-
MDYMHDRTPIATSLAVTIRSRCIQWLHPDVLLHAAAALTRQPCEPDAPADPAGSPATLAGLLGGGTTAGTCCALHAALCRFQCAFWHWPL